MNVDDIDEGGDALLCHTNKTNCCEKPNTNRAGEWYFPNQTKVGIEGTHPPENLFFRNRGSSIVRLNRRGNPLERGRFSCVVPDSNDFKQTIFVNIGIINNYKSQVSSPTVNDSIIP